MPSSLHAARRRATASLISLAGAAAAAGPAAAQLAPADTVALRAGDSAWTAGLRDAAARHYAVAIRADSARSSRAVARLAGYEAEHNRLGAAVTLQRLYTRIEPLDPAGEPTLAKLLSWAARYDEAVAVYGSALARDGDNRDAALGRAQTLAWASRFPQALAAYEGWLAAHPDDAEAELGLARTLAWAGRLDAAEARYARIASRGPSPDAEKGVARVAAWRGDLVRSERLWRELSARYPHDPEAWTGLAQVLRWTGRPGLAEDALRTALTEQPSYGDARVQLRWVGAELASSAEPVAVVVEDSDRNRSAYYGVTAGVRPPWTGRVLVTAGYRDASFRLARGRSSGARVVASWAVLAGRGSLRAEAGASRLAADTAGTPVAARTIVSGGLRGSAQVGTRVTLDAGAARAPFDETALLIVNGIFTDAADVGATAALPLRLTLSGGAGLATVGGGRVRNERRSGSAALRFVVRRGLSAGVAARRFGYSVAGAGDGYFSPSSFALTEANARAELGRDLGWGASLDGGLGRQTIRATREASPRSSLAERLGATLLYRPAPGLEWSAAYGFANVAAPGQVSAAEYRAHSFTLRARFRL